MGSLGVRALCGGVYAEGISIACRAILLVALVSMRVVERGVVITE